MHRARWLLWRGSEAGQVAKSVTDPVLECEACRFCLRPQATEPDHVRIRKALADHKVAPRLQDAPEFLERTALLWDLSECGNQVGGIEGAVWVGELPGVGARRYDVREAEPVRPAHRVVQHLLLHVRYVQPSLRREPPRGAEGVAARARTDLKHPLSRLRREDPPQPGAAEKGTGKLHPQPLGVGTGGGVLAPSDGPVRQQKRPDCQGGADKGSTGLGRLGSWSL